MKTEFNEPNLFQTFASYADREENHKTGLKSTSKDFNKFLKYAETIDYLIKNRRHLSDDEFVKLLTKYCSFMFDSMDMLRIISVMNGKNYFHYGTIQTQMFIDTENDKCSYNYVVAYTKRANIDFSYFYSIEELKKLEESKEIVLLTMREGYICDELDSINRKQGREYFKTHLRLENFYLNSCFKDLSSYLRGCSNEFKLAMLKHIRTNVTNSTLRKCMRDYLEILNNFLNYVTDVKDSHKIDDKLIRMCNTEFEKKGYNERLKRLNLEYGKSK